MMTPANLVNDLLSKALRGEPVFWPTTQDEAFENSFLDMSSAHEAQSLLHHSLSKTASWETWPERVRETVTREVLFQGVQKLLRKKELARVLKALHQKEISVFLMKGTSSS